MGFSDPIVGGIGTLIRQYIQSPDFIHAVSGWSINEDGSAEFNNIFARGDIDATSITVPAGADSPNPRIVIDNTGITAYAAGDQVVFRVDIPSPLLAFKILEALSISTVRANASDLGSVIDFETPGVLSIVPAEDVATFGGPQAVTWLFDNGGLTGTGQNLDAVTNPDLFKFGNGFTGGAYNGEWSTQTSAGGQSIVTATLTKLINLVTLDSHSDYGNGMTLASGVWTCPVSGPYIITQNVQYTSWVANSRALLRIVDNVTGEIYGNKDALNSGTTGNDTLTIKKLFTKNDQLIFDVLQVTGANRVVDATQSYVSISRLLG